MSSPTPAPAAPAPEPSRGRSELARIHDRYGPVQERVAELLKRIEIACGQLEYQARPGTTTGAGRALGAWLKSYNAGNESYVESFISSLVAEFAGRTFEVTRGSRRLPITPPDAERWEAAGKAGPPAVVIERQQLSRWAVRTTRFNYVFTVPGESPQAVVLVAHYDTWLGPGADDNTTGEEILKQYLLADLRAAKRPALTRIYFLAGSEECGLVGFTSQMLLTAGLVAANYALTARNWLYLAFALAVCPLAGYRFGVSGSREYVRALTEPELRRIRAVISVDSVGEGRLYIPRSTLGATFVRALIPFEGYDSLGDLLEEGAHLQNIKYNNYLAGGTTDHLSFLEVNNTLVARLAAPLQRMACRLQGRPYVEPVRIPASALIAMAPGKASPLVLGGKIHTPHDVPSRVYPQPLSEALCVLDYFFHTVEGGQRPQEPRSLVDYHYARLYRTDGAYYAVFKDAEEPNERNLNGVYRAEVTIADGHAKVELLELVDWGVRTRLAYEAETTARERGERWERVPLEDMRVTAHGLERRFVRDRILRHFAERLLRRGLARIERAMGHWSFLSFFGVSFLVAHVVDWLVIAAIDKYPRFALFVVDHFGLTAAVMIVVEVGLALRLIMRDIPTWIDNSYRHENRADNLGSLRRADGGDP